MEAQQHRKLAIDFPFKVTVEHKTLTTAKMFELAEAFDYAEVFGPSGNDEGKRGALMVDVLESTPTHTTLQVLPAQPMDYSDIAEHFEALLKGIGARFAQPMKVSSIVWLVANMGVASDLRGRLRGVK